MQLGVDILKLLFFPGLFFVAVCGALLLFVEGWLQVAFYGGRGPRLRDAAAGEAVGDAPTAGELAALAVSLAAMGVCGVLLIGVRGDLFALTLLFSSVEILSLYLVAVRGAEQAMRVPLLFRTALSRMVTLLCVSLALSLRFPGVFSPGLETLRGEGAPRAVQLWGGPGLFFIAASMACAGIAYFLYLLGRPACAQSRVVEGDIEPLYPHAALIEGPQRAVSLLLCMVLFLGYPWEGGTGMLLWAASALGTVMVATALRVWVEGHGSVLARRLQAAASPLALLSVALAFAAVIANGR